jgi:hypothetical protein
VRFIIAMGSPKLEKIGVGVVAMTPNPMIEVIAEKSCRSGGP